MNWSVDSTRENTRSLIYFTGLLILVIGLVTGRHALWIIAIFLFLLAYFSKKILLHMILNLELDNNETELRLISGEEGEFALDFINNSHLPFPIFQGYFTLDPLVTLTGTQEKVKEIKFELSVPARSSARVAFAVHADSRGVARIRSLHLFCSDPLHILQTSLSFDRMIKNRIIVYPLPRAARPPKLRQQHAFGFDSSPFSLFADFSAPVGTRDYQRSDSFRHIHWKASARLGKLQTKTFEKVAPVSWMFLLLTRQDNYKFHLANDFEQRLSVTIWLMRYAYNKGFRYSIFSNTKPMGSLLFSGIETDQGIRQLKKGLDFLAFTQRWQMKTPINLALAAIHQKLPQTSTIILIDGGTEAESIRCLRNWQKEGHTVYRLSFAGEAAHLEPSLIEGDE